MMMVVVMIIIMMSVISWQWGVGCVVDIADDYVHFTKEEMKRKFLQKFILKKKPLDLPVFCQFISMAEHEVVSIW